MTKNRLETILEQMAKDGWHPGLVDVNSGESWSFSTTPMACENGADPKKLPKDKTDTICYYGKEMVVPYLSCSGAKEVER